MNKSNSAGLPRSTRVLRVFGQFVYWILMGLVVLSAYLYYREPLPQPTERREKVAELQEQRDALHTQSQQLARRVEWLKDEKDPGYLIIEAREHMGMQRKDEVLLRVE
jgi:cell division protein FtsB